jgi:hypothetical protein
MRVIEAPAHAHVWDADVSVFLAGGITGCGDWQSEVIMRLQIELGHVENLIIFNPRRADFDVTDPAAARQQIEWEYDQLQRSGIVLFWFPPETDCPITLYELGYQLGVSSQTPEGHGGIDLVIGTDPNYARRQDVLVQCALTEVPIFGIHNDLESTVQALVEVIDEQLSLRNLVLD